MAFEMPREPQRDLQMRELQVPLAPNDGHGSRVNPNPNLPQEGGPPGYTPYPSIDGAIDVKLRRPKHPHPGPYGEQRPLCFALWQTKWWRSRHKPRPGSQEWWEKQKSKKNLERLLGTPPTPPVSEDEG